MNKLKLIIAILLLAMGGSAYADDSQSSWRLTAGGFSTTFSNAGAPLHGATSVNDGENMPANALLGYAVLSGETANSYCARYAASTVGLGAVIPTPVPGTVTPEQLAQIQQLQAQMAQAYAGAIKNATGECLAVARVPYQVGGSRKYNSVNLGIGAEFVQRDSDTKNVRRFGFGVFRDAFFNPSVSLSAGWQKNLYQGDRMTVDLGGTVAVSYSTVVSKNGIEDRRWIPSLMPQLSIEDQKSGFGANIMFTPKVQRKGTLYSVDTLSVRLTKRF